MVTTKSYADSCQQLIRMELLDSVPPMPAKMPQYDDEEPLGVRFFRLGLQDVDLSGLTLPRTYFCRSEFVHLTFRDSNFWESNLCWNDFLDVDFSGADLSKSDLRASLFERVLFIGSRLDGADMRRSTYVDCDFTDASLNGVIFARSQQRSIVLSHEQISVVAWSDGDGPEPDGG